jgi:hypothetical protein
MMFRATTLNNKSMFEECLPPPLIKPHETEIVDYGCTGHFLLVNAPCLNKVKSQNPLTVRLPNGATMESSHTAELNIPELNVAAFIAHVFPGMDNHYLLSVGQLCNEGYIVTFKNASVTICDPQEFQILSGARDLDTRLWRIHLRKDSQQLQKSVENNVYEFLYTGALVHYLHKALFSPTKSALLQAVKKGHLVTWPGLTEEAINTHLKLTPTTAMGHMNQRRHNIRPTSKTPITAAIEDFPATNTDLGAKNHLVYAVLVDQGQLYTDLTGKFPVRSSKGKYYIMVCYVYDCNHFNVVPMKSRSASEWVKSYDHIHQELTAKGFKPRLQTLDNEALATLKHFFTTNDVEYQLVPPHCHRRNAAERAIRTFKEHFVAGLSSVDPTFPLHLWDRLLPQAEITLNLLLTSRLHPQLSAAAHFHCLVDYNKTSFALPGCNIIAHEKPGNDALGHPTYNMDIPWAQKCISTAVKMSTSRPRLVNASWTHSHFSLTISRCHRCLPRTD